MLREKERLLELPTLRDKKGALGGVWSEMQPQKHAAKERLFTPGRTTSLIKGRAFLIPNNSKQSTLLAQT